MTREKVNAVCIAFALGILISSSSDVFACQNVFAIGLDPGQSAKTRILQAPDGRNSAWSEATMKEKPTVLHSKVLLANKLTGRRDVILQSSMNEKGRIIASNKKAEEDFYDGFCIVDWSPDSRYILVERMQGPLGSDAVWFETWFYDTNSREKHNVNLSALRREVERYWQGKRINISGYHVVPVGWETGHSNRIVYFASPANPGDEAFYGVWSLSRDGSGALLLAEDKEKYEIKHFAKTETTGANDTKPEE